jgi:ankyrin repeat protein
MSSSESWKKLSHLEISDASREDRRTIGNSPRESSMEDMSFDMSRSRTVGGLTVSTVPSAASTRDPSIDFATSAGFLESWSNVESAFLLGGVSTDTFPSLSNYRQESTRSLPAAASFGSLLDPTPMRRYPTVPNSGSPHALLTDSNGVSSVIHDAARIADWDHVLELCHTHPEAAAYSGRDGWTALHHACNRRCPHPHVIQALIQAYPEALLQEEVKCWLPLHLACRFKAPKEVVRLLLHMVPASGRIAVRARDRQRRTPLYYAIRYDAPDGVAGLLLHVDPSAVLEEDQNEESPLALVWDNWAEKLEGKRIVQSFLPGGFPEPQESTVDQLALVLRERLNDEPKLKKRWDQVNVLLKAAFGFPFEEAPLTTVVVEDVTTSSKDSSSVTPPLQQSERTWRIVHATAATKCHLSLFRMACALHPEQARELDESDLRRSLTTHGYMMSNSTAPFPNASGAAHQTALHLAASSNAGGENGKAVLVSLLRLYREAAQVQDGIDGSLPLHRMVENQRKDWPNHVAILYHFYPRAVQIPDHHGKLPLHRAAAAPSHYHHRVAPEDEEERSVIIQLVRSYPQAAGMADATGGLPFHYACLRASAWDEHVEAIYNAHRSAVQVRAGPVRQDRLPIHLAAENRASRDALVQRLIQLHPRGAAQEDRLGKLPLHIACEEGKDWNATRFIYEAFPSAVRQAERNARGWLPLHMAAACPEKDGDLIKRLTELYPEAASIPDHEDRYPLHIACSTGKDWAGGLRVLFDANPNALAMRDCLGFLPVHICALSFCQKQDESSRKTRATPAMEARKEMTVHHEEAAQLDILFNLFRSDPSTVQG